MKTLAIIAEYNPFHLGHKYHLEESIKTTNATHTIAIISSSFVQRGEPSIVDKWTKSKMALDNGFDLVIELPFVYSVQSAELFAYGAVEILDSLKIIDYLSFGAETNNLDLLNTISSILLEEPDFFRLSLKKHLDKGLSFASSRELALIDYLRENDLYSKDFGNILKQSNNILAIEYLKAIKLLDSNIEPAIVTRLGADYNETSLSLNFSSATSIRKELISKGPQSITKEVPSSSYKLLENCKYNHLNNYIIEINYLLNILEFEDYLEIFDMTEGLANRFLNLDKNYRSIDDLINDLSSKRYPRTRISRILIHLLSNLTKDDIVDIYSKRSNYMRILASNKKGFEIINKIKNNSNIMIINKFSDYYRTQDSTIKKILDYEIRASNLYFIHQDRPRNLDFIKSPYIKI